MKKLIYIADDEQHIRMMMKTFLENEGYEVEAFGDGYSVREAVQKKMPDMIILDIMMPGEDGLSLCTAFRKESGVPIMIVSAKDSPMDRVTLFRRVELSARGGDQPEQRPERYECGNLTLYSRERKTCIGEEAFAVTPTEFEFLQYLIERKEAAVSKKELLEQVWNCQGILDDQRMSDDLVKRLRKKLRLRNATAHLETVWGYGYRLTERGDSGTVL